MDPQNVQYEVSPEGVELLAQIVEQGVALVVGDRDVEKHPLSAGEQEAALSVIGSIAVGILQEVGSWESDD